MYTIIFSDLAKKQLDKLPPDIQKRVMVALERIRIRPEAYLTKLVGEQAYKLRVGDYRIIIDVDNQKLTLFIIKIGHRRDVYDF